MFFHIKKTIIFARSGNSNLFPNHNEKSINKNTTVQRNFPIGSVELNRDYSIEFLINMKHLLLCNSKQQVIADGNPYLRVNCILARSVERLNVQMLLNPFEETFHLPMSPIKFSNSQVRMCKVVGQEPIYVQESSDGYI